MSESKQPPKLLLHKPKKSQRPPPDPSSKGNGTGATRSVSSASGNSSPPLPEGKRPFWSRFRVPILTLLAMNAVVVGYTVFRTFTQTSEISEGPPAEKTGNGKEEEKPNEETATEKLQDETNPPLEIATEKGNGEKKPIKEETEKIKAEDTPSKGGLPEPQKTPQAISVPEVSKPKISSHEQQELYKWLLAEKRKVKPANKAEKAQIDAEKALLKDFLRGKGTLNV